MNTITRSNRKIITMNILTLPIKRIKKKFFGNSTENAPNVSLTPTDGNLILLHIQK